MRHFFSWLFQTATTRGDNSPAVNNQGGGNLTFNYVLSQPEEIAAALLRQMEAKGIVAAGPGAEKRVDEAVGDIARGAAGGDQQLQKALGLLKAGDVAEAAKILLSVAEEKTARIKKDSKDAAIAYRNLGAIAGLGNPKQALDAYRKTIELDPDDTESLLWAGWIESERGELNDAERRFRRVLALTQGNEAGWLRSWALTGIGDVLVAQGNLPEALKTYRDSLAIRDRLAKSDPGNAGWQRDLSVSFAKLAGVSRKMGASADALSALQQGRAIIVRMTNLSPDNAVWKNDLAWFDEQIKQMQ